MQHRVVLERRVEVTLAVQHGDRHVPTGGQETLELVGVVHAKRLEARLTELRADGRHLLGRECDDYGLATHFTCFLWLRVGYPSDSGS